MDEATERAFAYAQTVFQKMIRHYKRKNADPVVFAALFVLHQQALATYHALAARAHHR